MSKPFYFGMTVDDVALRDWSTVANFVHLVDFFKSEGVRTTFFVVPIDEETDQPFDVYAADYLDAIRAAKADGFEFGQHGLRHNRFELGIPPTFVLDLPHEIENKRYVAEHRAELDRDHSVENCRARLRQGREILERAFGFPLVGFRAPALQESPGMFEAIRTEGYYYDSSAILQESVYEFYADRMDAKPLPITKERFQALRAKSGGLTLAHTCDYTWFLPERRYEATLALAKHDLLACIANDLPFIPASHVSPVHEGEGIRFLHDIYQIARDECAKANREIRFTTLETIAREWPKA